MIRNFIKNTIEFIKSVFTEDEREWQEFMDRFREVKS